MGDLSEHFSRWEFRDRRTGALVGPDPALVQVLECLRRRRGRPLTIVSGYRSASTNRLVGGAARSLHLVGGAADIPAGYATVAEAVACGARGVGYRGRWAIHVDVRRGHPAPVIFAD